MKELLEQINGVVWGIPMLAMILGVGLYLSLLLGFAQIRLLPKALKAFFGGLRKKKGDKDGVSPFQALCTALAATVGTGNIAGVAGAIALGGPGTVFWIWISALLGMITKFAEAALAVRFRQKEPDGSYSGGPMYVIGNGMNKKWHWLGWVYSFFGVFAAFGVGNATQMNAVTDCLGAAMASFGCADMDGFKLGLGITMAVLLACVLLGGAGRIGKLSQLLVPVASILYLALGMGVILANAWKLPGVFRMIVEGAFAPRAVTGGVLGGTFCALRFGVSRGVFTNEAGMGTAGIAHACAETKHPVEQGLLGITEVFLDTIVICTMTALIILCSGVGIPYGTDPGAALTAGALESVYGPWVNIALTLCMCCFAFATMVGWGFYGLQCAGFLLGEGVKKRLILCQAGIVAVSTLLETGTVWLLADILNALMAVPNLVSVVALSPVLCGLLQEWDQPKRTSEISIRQKPVSRE